MEENYKYMLICNNCGTKHFTTGKDTSHLVEVKTAPLPKNANGVVKDTRDMPKKFKCYNCGYLFRIVALNTPKVEPTPEHITEQDFQGADGYLKQWENEVLRSARKKPDPKIDTYDPKGDIK